MQITIDCKTITQFCHPTTSVSEHVFRIKPLTTSKVQQTKSTSVSYQTKLIKQPEDINKEKKREMSPSSTFLFHHKRQYIEDDNTKQESEEKTLAPLTKFYL
jgi:hypothetical protein